LCLLRLALSLLRGALLRLALHPARLLAEARAATEAFGLDIGRHGKKTDSNHGDCRGHERLESHVGLDSS
jgi:hypothetical protein